MMKKRFKSRRSFIKSSVQAVSGVLYLNQSNWPSQFNFSENKLAISGGKPIRNKTWPKWPEMIVDEKMIANITTTTRSGAWSRINAPVNGAVASFEKAYAAALGSKYCVATGSGTQALAAALEALGIGPGDEVITSPYTDFGTISAILACRALPVMADLDRESYQINPSEVQKKITKNTKAIVPVHIMGSACDMDSIIQMAGNHQLYVVEDACQANYAKYKGKQLGTIGNMGCFSFQGSKQLACGEGGAVIGNDSHLMDIVYTIQNHGTTRKGINERTGLKLRMNEFEGSILLSQLPKSLERFQQRNENAGYLTRKLASIPGIEPQKQYPGAESSGYYLYAFSYKKEHFNGMERADFLKALSAEGIPAGGYIKGLHNDPWTSHVTSMDVYKMAYSRERLAEFMDSLDMPECDAVSNEVVVLNACPMLLGNQEDMDDIINSIAKIYEQKNSIPKN